MNAPRSNRPADLRNYSSDVFIEERDDFDFREQLEVFWRRKWVIAIVALVVVTLGGLYTMTLPAVFEATAKIALATTSSKSGISDDPILSQIQALDTSRTVETQVEVIKSPDLLDKAFNSLSKEQKTKGFDSTEIPSWSYSIESKPNSEVVNITGKAYTARLAAELANRIVKEYTLHDVETNRGSIKRTLAFVEDEMKRRGQERDDAMDALARYQKETGLVDAPQMVQNAANSYSALLTERSTAQTGLESAERSLGILENERRKADVSVDAARIVQENPDFTSSRQRLTALEAKRAELLEEYVQDAPEVVAIDNQIKTEQGKMQGITQRIVTSETSQRNPAIDKINESYVEALTQRAGYRERLNAANRSLDRVQSALEKFPSQQRDLALLQQKVTTLNNTYNLLSENYYSLKVKDSGTSSMVIPISEARIPKFKSYPRVLQNLIGFLFLGVLMGVGVAMLLEKLDTRVHDPFTVDRITGLTSLSAIPETAALDSAPVEGKLLIGHVENNHAFVESFRLLRNNIMFSSPDKDIKILSVTSPSKSEGKSTITVNLAIALAMDGKRVLIIDCDLRRPTIHTWMNVGREVGLTSVVKNITSLADAIKPTPFPNLDCLTSGPLPPNPTEFLNSDQTRMLFEQAANMYDVVVLDSPPCTGLSDVQVISTVSDGMVLVVSLNSTTKQSLVATTKMLRQAGAPMLGTAINRIQYMKSKYGFYAYSYYYYYSQYDEDEQASKKRKKRRRKNPSEPAGKA